MRGSHLAATIETCPELVPPARRSTACPATPIAGAHPKGGGSAMNQPIPDREEPRLFTHRLGRRQLVRTGGLMAGAAAVLAAPAIARAQDDLAPEATFDVALDGASVRYVKAAPGDPSGLPMTGDTFILFGSIFPAGTFDSGNLNPDQPGAIGRWICRGSFYVDLTTEAIPHAVTTVM